MRYQTYGLPDDLQGLDALSLSLKSVVKKAKKAVKKVTKSPLEEAEELARKAAKTTVKVVAKPVAKVTTQAAKATVTAVKKTGYALDKASQTAAFKVALAPVSVVAETARTIRSDGIKAAIKQLPAHNITQPFTAAAKLASQGVRAVAGKNTVAAKLASKVGTASDKLQTYSEKHPLQTIAAAGAVVGAAAAAPAIITAVTAGGGAAASAASSSILPALATQVLKNPGAQVASQVINSATEAAEDTIEAGSNTTSQAIVDATAQVPAAPGVTPLKAGLSTPVMFAIGSGLALLAYFALTNKPVTPIVPASAGTAGLGVPKHRRKRRRSRRR